MTARLLHGTRYSKASQRLCSAEQEIELASTELPSSQALMKNFAADAGKKAFITNRVGDWGFMLAMFFAFQATGTLSYIGVYAAAPTVSRNSSLTSWRERWSCRARSRSRANGRWATL